VKGAARTAGRRAVRMAARLGVRPAPKARRVAQVVRKTVSVPSSTTTHSS
jgi:hypothetical protein